MKKKIFVIIGIILIVLLLVFGYLFMFTEVIVKKAFPTGIKEMSINYVPSNDLNFVRENALDDSLISTIKLDKDSLNNIKMLLNKSKKLDKKYNEITNKFELIIDNYTTLVINEKESAVTRGKDKYMVNTGSLYNEIYNIVSKDIEKKSINIDFNTITIKKNHALINVKNEYNLDLLKNHLKYIEGSFSEDFIKNIGDSLIEVVTDKEQIVIYKNNISSIKNLDNNELKYVIVDEDLYSVCDSIYNSSTEKEKE